MNFYFAITRSEYRGGPNSTNQEGSHQTPRYSAKNDGYCNALALQDFRGGGALDHLGIILVLSSQRVLHKPEAVIKQLLSATYVSKSFLGNKCAHVNFPKEVFFDRIRPCRSITTRTKTILSVFFVDLSRFRDRLRSFLLLLRNFSPLRKEMDLFSVSLSGISGSQAQFFLKKSIALVTGTIFEVHAKQK